MVRNKFFFKKVCYHNFFFLRNSKTGHFARLSTKINGKRAKRALKISNAIMVTNKLKSLKQNNSIIQFSVTNNQQNQQKRSNNIILIFI